MHKKINNILLTTIFTKKTTKNICKLQKYFFKLQYVQKYKKNTKSYKKTTKKTYEIKTAKHKIKQQKYNKTANTTKIQLIYKNYTQKNYIKNKKN